MAYDLQNKVVLITGASRGIGRACALAFHRAGARVCAAARSVDDLRLLQDELGADRLLTIVMDVTDDVQRVDALRQIRDRFGRIDVLINNAGWAAFGTVQNISSETVERMVRLNFLSVVHVTRMVLPELIDRGHGQIINIASVVGHQPIAGMTVYSATKAALLCFSAGLRMELAGTGVDVIAISPGSTRTDFFDVAERVDVRAVRLANTQYTPERVARAVLKASLRQQRSVILTFVGKVIVVIRRVSPWLADMIMIRFARITMPRITEPDT